LYKNYSKNLVKDIKSRFFFLYESIELDQTNAIK